MFEKLVILINTETPLTKFLKPELPAKTNLTSFEKLLPLIQKSRFGERRSVDERARLTGKGIFGGEEGREEGWGQRQDHTHLANCQIKA